MAKKKRCLTIELDMLYQKTLAYKYDLEFGWPVSVPGITQKRNLKFILRVIPDRADMCSEKPWTMPYPNKN